MVIQPRNFLSENRHQFNTVKASKIAFPSINSEFGYLISKGLLIEVKAQLAHEAGGTNQKYYWREKKG